MYFFLVIIFMFCFHPNHYPLTPISYKILDPKGVEALRDSKDPKKAAQVMLDAVHLDAELYRLGNTKA